MDTATGVISGIIILLGVLFYAVPLIIIYWILVKKAGKPGWSQIIPLWSYYIQGIVGRNKRAGIIVIILSVLSILLDLVGPKGLSNFFDFLQFGSIIGLYIVFARQYTSGVGKWLVFLLVPIVGVFLTGKTQYKTDTPNPAEPTAPIASQPPVAPSAPIVPIS